MKAEGLPIVLIVSEFERLSSDLDSAAEVGTSADLTNGLRGAAKGARAAKATTQAWRDDTLDLRADLRIVYERLDPSRNMRLQVHPQLIRSSGP
jgi:hypothetical protein